LKRIRGEELKGLHGNQKRGLEAKDQFMGEDRGNSKTPIRCFTEAEKATAANFNRRGNIDWNLTS